MTEELAISVVQKPQMQAVIIRRKVSTMKLSMIMAPAFKILTDYFAEKKYPTTDFPYSCYCNIDWHLLRYHRGFIAALKMSFYKWTVEIGMIAPAHAQAEPGLLLVNIPAGDYIQVIHVGPYHKVGVTYNAMMDWAESQNVKLGDRAYEFYLNDSRVTPKEQLKTRILVPVG